MNHKAAILALQRQIDSLQQEQDKAVKLAAQPFVKEIADLRATIAHLKQQELNGSIHLNGKKPYTGKKRGRKPKVINSYGYPVEATMFAKFIYVIKQFDRFVTVGEIADWAYVYEQPKVDPRLLAEKFTKHTYKYKLKGLIASYTIGSKRNTVYGLPEWFKDGKPVKDKEHNPDELIDKPKAFDQNIFDEPKKNEFNYLFLSNVLKSNA